MIKYIKSVKGKKNTTKTKTNTNNFLQKKEGVSTIKYMQAISFRAGKADRERKKERMNEKGNTYSSENINTPQREVGNSHQSSREQ